VEASPKWVRANLVLGADGSTSLGGRSAGLSSVADRSRFHALRGGCDAILVGGATARSEPYRKTPKPLFILTRDSDLELSHPDAHLLNLGPVEAIGLIRESGHNRILMESGANLLRQFLALDLLDGIHLTITPAAPNEARFPISELLNLLALNELELITDESVGEEHFLFFSRSSSD
jgi:riboflavin biosynthesis pyrimidine reductase